MQKHVNLVDLVKSFPTNIYLQKLASIQKRTSPVKFAHLAEKSGKGSISNLSTKVEPAALHRGPRRRDQALGHHRCHRERAYLNCGRDGSLTPGSPHVWRTGWLAGCSRVRRRMNNELHFTPNFDRLVLGCIDADFCK